jgi:integrase
MPTTIRAKREAAEPQTTENGAASSQAAARRRPRRRGNGEGAIGQRTDGTWQAIISLDGGKRRWLYGRTRKEVQRKLAELTRGRDQGLPVPSDRLILETYLAQWLDDIKPRVRPSTHRSYSEIARLHIIPTLGKVPIARLSPVQVQSLLNAKLAAGTSPRRVQMIHGILRTALGRAYKWQLVSQNVAKLADPPRVTRPQVTPLKPSEAMRLLAVAEGHPHEHLYAFMLATGLRVGEALALRWQDVDLEEQRFRVRHTLLRPRGGGWEFGQPKSSSGRRTIPLVAPALRALRSQRRRIAELRLVAGPRWEDHDLVFPSNVGTPISGTNVLHEFKHVLARAGLPTTFRLHDLRHSMATYALAAGVPARAVQDLLGHAQITLTLGTYSHVLHEVMEDARKRLDAFWATAQGS